MRTVGHRYGLIGAIYLCVCVYFCYVFLLLVWCVLLSFVHNSSPPVIVSSAPFLSNCNLGSLLGNIDIGNGKTPTAAICSPYVRLNYKKSNQGSRKTVRSKGM